MIKLFGYLKLVYQRGHSRRKIREPVHVKAMSVFTKKLNPLTGASEWVLQNEDYDFHQEIARSKFADMLHDTERNEKYYAAIKAVVEQTHRAGCKAHVLDIGTGTGLLAMMAARCGADTIYACEAFSPVSQCAEQVIAENGLSDRITVIHKRSTEMTAGPGGDLPQRANILVTEVFDTELIGEGAVYTFNHAHKHLLEKDCLVVPTGGTVFAQVVDSHVLQRWNRLEPWAGVEPSRRVSACAGAAAVHDLQLSQVRPQDYHAVTDPLPVFRFDWTGRSPIPRDDSSDVPAVAVSSGTADTVFMWWSLDMDPQGSIVLSCAPWWAHPSQPAGPDDVPWRDHWMQAVYYLPSPAPVTRGQPVHLLASRDEFSLWFNLALTANDQKCSPRPAERPVCECMLHVTCSRTRLGMLNDPARRAGYLRVLRRLVSPQTVALSWGDTSLLPLVTAALGAEKVYHVEENIISRDVMSGLVKDNNLDSKVTLLKSADIDDTIRSSVNLVLAEPYFMNTLYPWDVLRYWFVRQQCPAAVTMPVSISLHAMVVQFDHLHKIRAPLGTVCGFDLTAFDKLVQGSSAVSDSAVEVHPLWEYPGVCLSAASQLQLFDMTSPLPSANVEAVGHIPVTSPGTCHGVALWVNIQLDEETTVTTGPLGSAPVPGGRVSWDPYSRQGVYFLSPEPVTTESAVEYRAVYSPNSGEINFIFNVKK